MPVQSNHLRELIDGHAHLNEVYDIEGALERAVAAGVARIVAVGMDIASNRRVLEIAASYPGLVLPSVGFHPWPIPTEPIEATLAFVRTHLATCTALGEVGLDYKATEFYEAVLDTPPNTSSDGITFIELPGAWISLYPIEKLAEDISPEIPIVRGGFSGIAFSHNTRNKDDVIAIVRHAESAGARAVKEPQETFWGGFSGYFADLDGYYWEVAWGPMFEFTEKGETRFKENA